MKNNDFKIRSFIKNQFPGFILQDHPIFVSFLEAYYEWLESNPQYLRSPSQLKNINDIDDTLDIFLDDFKKTYLATFPIDLLVRNEKGEKISPKKLIKNIKQFYAGKGIERSYNFIFRILYSSDIEIYYPKEFIFNLSDGVWVSQKKMFVETDSFESAANLKEKRICQRSLSFDPTSTLLAEAKINDAVSYRVGGKIILELTISEVVGTFTSEELIFDLNSGKNYGKIYSTLTDIKILDRGSGYQKNQRILFENPQDPDGIDKNTVLPFVKISRVVPGERENSGGILEITILDSGLNVTPETCVLSGVRSVPNDNGSGFDAELIFGPIFEKREYYLGSRGTLSSNMVFQDNFKYQEYSYVIRSDISISKYRDQIKGLLHPAGVNLLGEILIRSCVAEEPSSLLNIPQIRIRRIGNFLPYTFLTFENLGEWMNKKCYDPDIHDELVICGTADCITGNPIISGFDTAPQGITCTTADLIDGLGSYWVTFNNPNLSIRRSFGTIRFRDLEDFYGPTTVGENGQLTGQSSDGWEEWNFYGETTQDTQNQIDWLSFLLNSQSKTNIATLNISNSTQFRKIPIYAFLDDLACDYDCRFSNSCVDPNANKTSPIDDKSLPVEIKEFLSLPGNILNTTITSV